MGYQYSFEKLDVWNDERYFVKEVYKITSNFPEKEKIWIKFTVAKSFCFNSFKHCRRGIPKFSERTNPIR